MDKEGIEVVTQEVLQKFARKISTSKNLKKDIDLLCAKYTKEVQAVFDDIDIILSDLQQKQDEMEEKIEQEIASGKTTIMEENKTEIARLLEELLQRTPDVNLRETINNLIELLGREDTSLGDFNEILRLI